MEFHEVTEAFPVDESKLDELVQDIAAHGQKSPIETFEGKIIHGRLRWLACQRLGIEPILRQIETDDPMQYLFSFQLPPGLTSSQRAFYGLQAKPYYTQVVQRARLRGQEAQSQSRTGLARDMAGRCAGTSGYNIDCAERLLKQAIPEIIAAVKENRLSMYRAKESLKLSREAQLQLAQEAKGYKAFERGTHAEKGLPSHSTNGISSSICLANEAIDVLKRIPKTDALRARAFSIVKSWIANNR